MTPSQIGYKRYYPPNMQRYSQKEPKRKKYLDNSPESWLQTQDTNKAQPIFLFSHIFSQSDRSSACTCKNQQPVCPKPSSQCAK